MVLAAGRGDRMRPLTYRLGKPALPVLNRPLVGWALELLRRGGVRRAAVNLHHLPETVRRAVRDSTPAGMEVSLLTEEELLGTGGGVRNAESVLRNGPFFLANGDTVLDADPGNALETHRRSGAVATMVLLPYQERSRYTPVRAADGRVLSIGDLPAGESRTGTRYLFTGLHVVEPSVLDRIPAGGAPDIIRNVYAILLSEGQTIAAHVLEGAWVEIGTPAEYLRRSLQLLSPPFRPAVESMGVRLSGDGDDVYVAGEGVRLSESASLRDGVVLGQGSVVGQDVKLRRSIVWRDAVLSYGCDLCDSIVGEGVILPPETRFHHRIVLARGDDLPSDAGGQREGDLVHFRL